MEPVISVRGLTREFTSGGEPVQILRGIDLDIFPGEMVAIIGASGSGKSTLMNILGCLDQPTAGSYLFHGQDIAGLEADDLAALRREHLGFIFQRYQLLSDLDAVENVEMPAVYAGARADDRRARAEVLLDRLGLGDRMDHRPSQLSGGQQQRVSVARALMNGGEVILADEPTGALDSKSGEELMRLLAELHGEGHTIIIVTHDPAVAARADRVIEIRDGAVIADRRRDDAPAPAALAVQDTRRKGALSALAAQFTEALQMAVRAMISHRLRTFLTMLGIVIGIASVVGVVAMGNGSQATVLENIASIGTDTITVGPGSGQGDRGAAAVETLTPADADALAALPFVEAVSPGVSAQVTVTQGAISANTQAQGVGVAYFDANGRTFVAGTGFDAAQIAGRAQVAVIDETAAETLFGSEDPLGQVVTLGNVPVRITGVVTDATSFGPGSSSLNVWVPYSTVMGRLTGQDYLSSITVRVDADTDSATAESEITATLLRLHGTQDFYLRNSDTIRETITSTSETLTVLVAAIAVLSLIVGGIGVMNIMLVSVSERTREIGVRMAVGARRRDILRQFLIEAVLVCLAGGIAGVALAFGAGSALTALAGMRMEYSTLSIAGAFAACSAIGIAFGFFPARAASRLNPVEALSRD